MSKNKQIWDTKENADAYEAYANTFSMYKDTSRNLVEIAGITAGLVVVDLAAGTGATTEAIIEKVGQNIKIFAVDQAEEMLKKIKVKFLDTENSPNTFYVTSEAEELNKVVQEKVDVVVCNSAFWQMRAKETLKAISNTLKQGGVFALNLPDTFFTYKDFKKQPINPLPYSQRDLVSWGKECSLILSVESVVTYTKTASDRLAFNEIPVMRRNFKTKDEELKFIANLKNESVKNSTSEQQWVFFVFKKVK